MREIAWPLIFLHEEKAMTKLLHNFEQYLRNDTFFIFDDFDHYVTADTWTTTASDSGTVTVSDGVGGVVKIDPSSDGTNSQVVNDETYVESTTEIFSTPSRSTANTWRRKRGTLLLC